MRHGTGLRSTHIMVVKLVRLIIETGIFTGKRPCAPSHPLTDENPSDHRDPSPLPVLRGHVELHRRRPVAVQSVCEHDAGHPEQSHRDSRGTGTPGGAADWLIVPVGRRVRATEHALAPAAFDHHGVEGPSDVQTGPHTPADAPGRLCEGEYGQREKPDGMYAS